jgi:hypothetical protein
VGAGAAARAPATKMNERLEEDNIVGFGSNEWLRKDAREEQRDNATTGQGGEGRDSINSEREDEVGRRETRRRRRKRSKEENVRKLAI